MSMIDQESLYFWTSNEVFADMFNYVFWKSGIPNKAAPKGLHEMDGKQNIDVVNGK